MNPDSTIERRDLVGTYEGLRIEGSTQETFTLYICAVESGQGYLVDPTQEHTYFDLLSGV